MPAICESWKFGPFELTPDTGELWNSGRPAKLAPQPCQVLAAIVRAGGALVTREQLRAAVWVDGTTVEFDQGLNYCVRQIRIALDDDARKPTYIETLPKRGYRLLVPAVPAPNRAPPAASARERLVRLRYPIVAAATCLVLVAALFMRHPAAPSPVSTEADRLFQEAEHLAGTWEVDKVSTAVARYEEVLRLEPAFARAWAGLANANVTLAFVGPRPEQALADSERQAGKAVELDGSLPVARAALGHANWHRWQWRAAQEQFQLAIKGGDNVAVVHHLFGLYLASVGRSSEAISHARRAAELAPMSGVINHSLGVVYLSTGQFDAALAQAKRTLEIDRHFPPAYQTLVRANIQLGRTADASEALDAELRYSSENGLPPWRAYLLARQGRLEEAVVILAARRAGRPRPRGSIAEAAAFVALGDVDGAFHSLEEAVGAHVPSLLWLQVAPELVPLRSDGRFAGLLARMNAPRVDRRDEETARRTDSIGAVR